MRHHSFFAAVHSTSGSKSLQSYSSGQPIRFFLQHHSCLASGQAACAIAPPVHL